ncbi:MAG: hypothetical protein Q4C52_10585 [Eubacteriales bacterium]|nr:hypothetical protein [Eubacteriales bacterium]
MFYNMAEVQIIKLAVWNLEGLDNSSRDALLGSISWLTDKYKRTEDKEYLIKAVWHIYAYIELGFPHSDVEQEYQLALIGLNMEDDDWLFGFLQNIKKIPLTRIGISGVLGRWNPKLHSMPIQEAVTDIMQKVSDKKYGKYLYHSGKEIARDKDSALWESTFRLCVSKNGSILQDLNKSKYYMFMEKK